MPTSNNAKRRSREARAKSFAFILRQFQSIAKRIGSEELPDDDGKLKPYHGPEHSIVTYWECFFPEIRGRDYTRSKYETGNDPAELLEMLQPGVDDMMGQVGLTGTNPLTNDSVFDKTCLVGWLLRSKDGPFLGLITSVLFDQYFGGEALKEFRSLLSEDFRSPAYLFHEFDECIDAITRLYQGAARGYTEPWPDKPSQYARYLVKKAQGPKDLDLRADLATALIIASLNGPRDYRPELLLFSREVKAVTDMPAWRAKHRWDAVRDAVDTGVANAYLTRVTFPTDPADAREWMPCESPTPAMSSEGVGTNTITYPLKGLDEILLKRAADRKAGASRFTKEGTRVTIPLDCPRVSAQHARLTHEEDGWYLTDLDSTNGTLLVRVDDDRFHLCRDGLAEVRDNHVRLKNGDVICLSPDWANEQPLRDSPAFVFQLTASKW